MSRKKSGIAQSKLFGAGAAAAVRSIDEVRNTPESKRMVELCNRYAQHIKDASDHADTVEELILLELKLQELDYLSAISDADRTSIENSKKDYAQLVTIIGQMRKDPRGYLLVNSSIKETRNDFRKLPKSRGPQQINANKARMQNRAAFSPPEQKSIWDARVKLAARTLAMFLSLHNGIVTDHETADE